MIQEILKKIGFNDKEVEIYLEALRLGRSTPVRIAKNTGINRTTVYSVAKSLIQKGVLTEDIGQKYIYLIALPPEQLANMLEKKRKRSKKRKNLSRKLWKNCPSCQPASNIPCLKSDSLRSLIWKIIYTNKLTSGTPAQKDMTALGGAFKTTPLWLIIKSGLMIFGCEFLRLKVSN